MNRKKTVRAMSQNYANYCFDATCISFAVFYLSDRWMVSSRCIEH